MFSPDSKFMEIFGRITDLILLNLLFIITCLPVFTIGAASAALYTLCFRLMREEYSGIVKSYFRAFRDNFKPATAVWGILLAAAVPAVYYLSLTTRMEGILAYSGFIFLLILILVLMTGSYVFPWISQFENTPVQSLKNALILSISRLPRTFCILVINLIPLIVWFFSAQLFIQVSFLWIALYFAAAAYMNTGLLWHVFKPFRNV
jgi:uncharacterized membrane protein YesL